MFLIGSGFLGIPFFTFSGMACCIIINLFTSDYVYIIMCFVFSPCPFLFRRTFGPGVVLWIFTVLCSFFPFFVPTFDSGDAGPWALLVVEYRDK